MTEYIEREKAIANSREYNLGGSYDNTELAVPVDAINSIPAADVRPVVRAEFVRCGDGKSVPYMCSHCGRTTPANVVEIWGVNYCPNCGADMREES